MIKIYHLSKFGTILYSLGYIRKVLILQKIKSRHPKNRLSQLKKSKWNLIEFAKKHFWTIIAATIAILIVATSPAPALSTGSQIVENQTVSQSTIVAQQPGYVDPATSNQWKVNIDASLVNFVIIKTAPNYRTQVSTDQTFYSQLVCDDLNEAKNFRENRLIDRSSMIRVPARYTPDNGWEYGDPKFVTPISNIESLGGKYWESALYMREPLLSKVRRLCGLTN